MGELFTKHEVLTHSVRRRSHDYFRIDLYGGRHAFHDYLQDNRL